MCYKVDCPKCNCPTWKGCGKHIEQALKDVPKEERCACVKENCKICGCVLEAKSAKDMEEVLLHHNKDQH